MFTLLTMSLFGHRISFLEVLVDTSEVNPLTGLFMTSKKAGLCDATKGFVIDLAR